MAEDNALISRAQSGDEQAFAELMRAYYAFVYRIVIDIVNNPHDAEEVVQDTFFNVYRGLAHYEERTKFGSWLAKIARNRALNWRRAQREDTVSINDVGEGALQYAGSPDEQLIRDEQLEMVRRAINALSQKDREIARSYYLEGASYDELIRAHGLSYKAISFRLSRAKRTLAKRLQYLLTVAFVPPTTTLKNISIGGLTAMKIGTVSKITVGIIAIIALAFFGARQLLSPEDSLAPSVEVTLSTADKPGQSDSENEATRKNVVAAPSQADEPQISAEEMEQVEDFFGRLEAADAQSALDTPQLTADAEIDWTSNETDTTELSETSANTIQSPEDVMSAYIEAVKNLDFEVMGSLMTGSAREGFEVANMDPEKNKDWPAETRQRVKHMMIILVSRLRVVNSEYVGDEFHFVIGGEPLPESNISGMDMPETGASRELYKMQKENGSWRIYDIQMLN